MSEVKNRIDFIYVFDVQDGNPNGDPDAGNLPRVDAETGMGLVTDVCLKRKIEMHINTKAVKESSKGQSLTITDADVKYFTAQSTATVFDEEEGGSILVQDITSSAITLKFNTYKLSDGSNTLTLNGVLKFDL